MASIAYWIIGVLVVGVIIGIVNYAFTPRFEAPFPKILSYHELMQAEAEMMIAFPAQDIRHLSSPAAVAVLEGLESVVPASNEGEAVFSVSDIPEDMEDSISELFSALAQSEVETYYESSGDNVAEFTSVMEPNSEIPDWVLAAELEASQDSHPLLGIQEGVVETGSTEESLDYEFAGLEPPVFEDFGAPAGYEEIALKMDDFHDPFLEATVLSKSSSKAKGNVIPFPGAEQFHVPERAPYHLPVADYRHIHQLYGDLADRVTTTPGLGPRYPEDVMVGIVVVDCDVVYLEFRGNRIPVSKNAKAFVGETVLVIGQYVSEQKFLAAKIQLAQEVAKARQAI